jgi:hypothetical protein
MKLKRSLIVIALCLMLMLPAFAFAADDDDEVDVKIADVKLKNAIRELCGVKPGDDLYVSHVDDLTGAIDLSDNEIKDASGIKYLVNATRIDLSHNEIIEIGSNLSALTKLTELDLSYNNIYNTKEISIASIPNLKILNISANKMTFLPSVFASLEQLESLDFSANRMVSATSDSAKGFPIELLDFKDLKNLNCNYNFYDLSDGSKDREIMDKLSKTCDIKGSKQLVSLSGVTYSTDGGNLVVEWQELDDVTFYDGTSAEIVGFAVLVDGNYIKSANRDDEYAVVKGLDGSKKHTVSVSPNFEVAGYDDFEIRSYTKIENVSIGGKGPDLDENETPEKHKDYFTAPVASASPEASVAKKAEETAEPEATAVTAPVEVEELEDNDKNFSLTMPIVLLGVIVLLILVIAFLLISLLKNKNLVGKKSETDETDDLI